MSKLSRVGILLISAAFCAGGLIWSGWGVRPTGALGSELFGEIASPSDFEFASADLHRFSFAQLEEIIRADAATRFPNARVELGSVKAERGALVMNVVLFGPNHDAQAFLYTVVAEKNSWKIASTHRLWFVPPTQIARGLRV